MSYIKRSIDEMGRIVIPKDLRNKLGLTEKSQLIITEYDGKIILELKALSCKICGSNNHIDKQYHICSNCISKIKKLK